jgi:hypothetical protein
MQQEYTYDTINILHPGVNTSKNVPRFRKGKRNRARVKVVVPVRVRLPGATHSHKGEVAYTLNATECGVKLAGLKCELKVGDKIEIQNRHERAFFRVIWVKPVENWSEVHVGAECVDRDKNIWSVEFPQRTDEYEEHE